VSGASDVRVSPLKPDLASGQPIEPRNESIDGHARRAFDFARPPRIHFEGVFAIGCFRSQQRGNPPMRLLLSIVPVF
jgi:hypothetical protein